MRRLSIVFAEQKGGRAEQLRNCPVGEHNRRKPELNIIQAVAQVSRFTQDFRTPIWSQTSMNTVQEKLKW